MRREGVGGVRVSCARGGREDHPPDTFGVPVPCDSDVVRALPQLLGEGCRRRTIPVTYSVGKNYLG